MIAQQGTDHGDITGLAIRDTGDNPDHHLYRNGHLWWCQFTVHCGPIAKRIRLSLRTRDIAVARARRDRYFCRIRRGIEGRAAA